MSELTEVVDNILQKLHLRSSRYGLRPVALFRDFNFTQSKMDKVIKECLDLDVIKYDNDRIVIADRALTIMEKYKSWKHYLDCNIGCGGFSLPIPMSYSYTNSRIGITPKRKTMVERISEKILIGVAIELIAKVITRVFTGKW